MSEEVCALDLLGAKLGVDVGHLGGSCTLKQKKCFHGASPMHADRTNTRTAARNDELAAPAAAAAAAVVVVVAAAAAVGEDNMVDPVAGKALIEKKSQKMQVRQGLSPWGLDTRIHYRSHDDQ